MAIHPTVPWGEGHFDSLVRVKGLRWTSCCCVSHCLGCFVVDVHVEDVISSKHTICRLESPVVGVRTVNWHHTLEDLIAQAAENVWFTKGNVHRFHIEDHTLDVVCS